MYNAIFDDELINSFGLYKERLSQSALIAKMREVTDAEVCMALYWSLTTLQAATARKWLDDKGMKFVIGKDEATELTDAQVLRSIYVR